MGEPPTEARSRPTGVAPPSRSNSERPLYQQTAEKAARLFALTLFHGPTVAYLVLTAVLREIWL